MRAEGKILSSEKISLDNGSSETFHNVKDYKLFISTNKTTEELLLSEKDFNGTFVQLLFVGDIDKDGKLDFLFEANRDYEEQRYILYLSSPAQQDKIIKKVAEIAEHIDC